MNAAPFSPRAARRDRRWRRLGCRRRGEESVVRRLGQLLLDWGGFALKHPMAFLLTFALGGGFTFAYSYIPLHTVKLQKIERLERSGGVGHSARDEPRNAVESAEPTLVQKNRIFTWEQKVTLVVHGVLCLEYLPNRQSVNL